MSNIKKVLIDSRNFDDVAPFLIEKISEANLIGFDIETHDAHRHEGLNQFMRADEEGRKSNSRPLVFDTQRTVVCGFSVYVDGDDTAYYVNLNHADVENRLPWFKAKRILDAKRDDANWVCHNLTFEIVMMKNSLGFEVKNGICTMQMAVSAWNPDEYDPADFRNMNISVLKPVIEEASRVFVDYDGQRDNMTGAQGELFSKFISKESKAAHSYNGIIKSISRPYDLKGSIKYWFGIDMDTFEETLDGEVHMGKLTGSEVVSYGCDDSYWAVRLYHKILAYMIKNCPSTVEAFFNQELPAVEYYADVWSKGVRINLEAVKTKRLEERITYANVLREMKAAIRALLPFPNEPHPGLEKYDGQPKIGSKRAGWYFNGRQKYRKQIVDWATSQDLPDDFREACKVRGAVSNAWALDVGAAEPDGLSIAHYMPVRTMIYDLLREKVIVEKGKIQSDGEARGALLTRIGKYEDSPRKTAALKLLECMGSIAKIEQRAKLYLNPYLQLTDPETSRVYPVIKSLLASRRCSLSHPNGQQLAKRGESTYIRGFYEPDYEDHLILSSDWSGIELVEIGDFSGDPEFKKAFGQLPYEDLHLGATASCLSVMWDFVTEEYLKNLSTMDEKDIDPRILTNISGDKMSPSKALKYWRTEVGKGANFNFWFSGSLSTVGERLGWTSDQMWEATDRYKQRFAVAEAWRLATIDHARTYGYVQLPDGHRRVRYEATQAWVTDFKSLFAAYDHDIGVMNFVAAAIKAIQTRARNQSVNSMIQGSCATMMKRSVIRLRKSIKERGWTDREVRPLFPIHDELLLSVHRDLVVDAIKVVKEAMCVNDIVKNLPLTVAPAIGRTFEPFIEGNKNTQIELAELSAVPCIPKERWGKEATDDETRNIVNWIYS